MSLVTLAIVKLDKVYACGPNWETEAGRAYMQDLDRPSLNQEKLPLVLGMNHESLWDNHAKSVLLALMHRWGTHALVKHVCLMAQLCVLTQMLSDHLHPLHLQPFQLLQRKKKRPEAPESILNSGTFPLGRCQTTKYSIYKVLAVHPQPL